MPRNGPERVTPAHGAVIAEHEVEGSGREGEFFAVRVYQRQVLRVPPGPRELSLGHVEPDDEPVVAGDRASPLAGAAAELEDAEAREVAQDVQLRLGDRPATPQHRLTADLGVVALLVRGADGVPVGPVRGVMRRHAATVTHGPRPRSGRLTGEPGPGILAETPNQRYLSLSKGLPKERIEDARGRKPDQREGHRLPGGPDRHPHQADRGPDEARAGQQEGPPQPARPAEARRTKRRRLLAYLEREDFERYKAIVEKLGSCGGGDSAKSRGEPPRQHEHHWYP